LGGRSSGAPPKDAPPTTLEWATSIPQSPPALQSVVTVVAMRRGVRQAAGAILQGEAEVWPHQARGAKQVPAVSMINN